jgi:hypothetical protein
MAFLCSIQVVINTEWGALGNTGSLDFIRTKFDHLVDDFSKNPGHQASHCSATLFYHNSAQAVTTVRKLSG